MSRRGKRDGKREKENEKEGQREGKEWGTAGGRGRSGKGGKGRVEGEERERVKREKQRGGSDKDLNSIPPLLHIDQLLLQLLPVLNTSGYQLLALGTHALVHRSVGLNVGCRLLHRTTPKTLIQFPVCCRVQTRISQYIKTNTVILIVDLPTSGTVLLKCLHLAVMTIR